MYGSRQVGRVRAGFVPGQVGIRRHHEDPRHRLDQQLLEGARQRPEGARSRMGERKAGDGARRARSAGEGDDLRRRQCHEWLRVLHPLAHRGGAEAGDDGRHVDGTPCSRWARQRNQSPRQRPAYRGRPAVQMRLLLFWLAVCANAHGQSLAIEEFAVPARDPGVVLYMRNKHLAGQRVFPAEKVLLYVHGSTYPSETTFDFAVDGFSWMDYIARHGYDVYLVDVRGYGRSTRPPQMDAPPRRNPPLVTTATAVKDVAVAIDFILERRGIDKINLIGWSWGTTIMGWYAAENNSKVNKLVLYAPQWVSRHPVAPKEDVQGAYRMVTRASVKRHWLSGVPAERRPALIPDGWFDAWANATFATDPLGSK